MIGNLVVITIMITILLHNTFDMKTPLVVLDGRAGAVGYLASLFPPHPLGGVSWSGTGQRVLLRPGKPCTPCWHYLKRGQ